MPIVMRSPALLSFFLVIVESWFMLNKEMNQICFKDISDTLWMLGPFLCGTACWKENCLSMEKYAIYMQILQK